MLYDTCNNPCIPYHSNHYTTVHTHTLLTYIPAHNMVTCYITWPVSRAIPNHYEIPLIPSTTESITPAKSSSFLWLISVPFLPLLRGPSCRQRFARPGGFKIQYWFDLFLQYEPRCLPSPAMLNILPPRRPISYLTTWFVPQSFSAHILLRTYMYLYFVLTLPYKS